MTTDTKTDLLDAAERRARSQGFDGFSYADLAKDVGIRKASIHHHFPTKAALSLALMQRYSDTLQHVCKDFDTKYATAGERLLALIDQYETALKGGESLCLCVAFSTSRDSLPEDATQAMRQFREGMLDWISTVFNAGKADQTISSVQDPSAEAAATLALLEGAQLSARVEKNMALFRAAVGVLKARVVLAQ